MSDDESTQDQHDVAHLTASEAMKEVYENTFWCIFAGCEGFGLASCCEPHAFITQRKILCYEESQNTTECCGEEGCFFGVSKMLCCVGMVAGPCGNSAKGIPACALCNKRCGGGELDGDDMTAVISKDTFLLCSVLGQGRGILMGGDDVPLVYGDGKLCCLRSHVGTAECNDEDTGCCYLHEKSLCCVYAAACPPGGGIHDGIPTCALLGKVFVTNEAEGNAYEEKREAMAPEQDSMEDG